MTAGCIYPVVRKNTGGYLSTMMSNPYDVAVDGDGNLYIAANGGARVVVQNKDPNRLKALYSIGYSVQPS
jgi:hypothetical protein